MFPICIVSSEFGFRSPPAGPALQDRRLAELQRLCVLCLPGWAAPSGGFSGLHSLMLLPDFCPLQKCAGVGRLPKCLLC